MVCGSPSELLLRSVNLGWRHVFWSKLTDRAPVVRWWGEGESRPIPGDTTPAGPKLKAQLLGLLIFNPYSHKAICPIIYTYQKIWGFY